MTETGDIAILTDIVNSGLVEFDASAAQAVLGLRFSEKQRQRMLDLADRNNRGELSGDELRDMESYQRVASFLSLWHSKARLTLKRQTPDA